MICARCLRALARQTLRDTHAAPNVRPAHAFSRTYSTPVTAQTTTATNPRPNGLPAATATPAVAQPFSTPLTPNPDTQADLPITKKQTKAPAKAVQSSMPAGTVLKGLNYFKNKPDPVAGEDAEYPDWLWTVLAPKKSAGAGEDGVGGGGGGGGGGAAGAGEGDLFAKSKKQRRIAAKALRKQQLLHPESLVPKVPLTEQTIDLPAGDGTVEGAKEAARAREELTAALRGKRRKEIKDANYLRSMR